MKDLHHFFVLAFFLVGVGTIAVGAYQNSLAKVVAGAVFIWVVERS